MKPTPITKQNLIADDPLYDTRGAASYLGLSIKTLERYRLTGLPAIPYIKFPGRNGPVRYRKSSLDAFLAAALRTTTSEGVR